MKVAVVVVACLLHILSSGVVHGANPNYSYHVKIDDPSHVNFQEKAETRKGEDAQGFYSVLEPNGALRTVSYIADERGFNPIVSYSYGHPQSSVAVTSVTGPAAIVKQPGVYAPAYVSDSRVQIVDKSNIFAAPPPALNVQAFALPGPSAPVVVPAPLRRVAPVVKASAAIATNYAPAFVPSPEAYLPPAPLSQVIVKQPQVLALPPPQAIAIPQPPPLAVVQQPAVFTKVVQPSKYLTVPAVKVVKAAPAFTAIVKDSYAEPPRDTFRDPNAESYPDAVAVREPVADYGPPSYLPPPPLGEVAVAPVKVAQPVVRPIAIAPPPVLSVQKVVAAPPPPAIAFQQVVAAPPPVAIQAVAPPPPAVAVNPGIYAGAIGFHTHTVNPDSFVHAYGTQGFQVTTSRKYNKAVLAVPKIVKAPTALYGPPAVAVAQPVAQPVYGPPPVAVTQTVVQPPPVYGPPPVAVAQKVVQPVYGPPPPVRVVAPRPVYGPPPVRVVQQLAVAPPPPVVQTVVSAPVALPPPVAVAAPLSVPQIAAAPIAPIAPAPIAIAGKKQNPLTFAYAYDQGGAKVTHSYSGSGW